MMNNLEKLTDLVNTRPGMDWANYGCPTAWNNDRAKVSQAKRDFDRLAFLARGLTDKELENASRIAWGGRVSFMDTFADYTTGQYFAVEYRSAACAVLAEALKEHYRDAGYFDDSGRAFFTKLLGRGIARRWF